MVSFNKPTNLNGTELRQELNAAGVIISDNKNAVVLDGDTLSLEIATEDEPKAKLVVATHNGTIQA